MQNYYSRYMYRADYCLSWTRLSVSGLDATVAKTDTKGTADEQDAWSIAYCAFDCRHYEILYHCMCYTVIMLPLSALCTDSVTSDHTCSFLRQALIFGCMEFSVHKRLWDTGLINVTFDGPYVSSCACPCCNNDKAIYSTLTDTSILPCSGDQSQMHLRVLV